MSNICCLCLHLFQKCKLYTPRNNSCRSFDKRKIS